MTGVTTVSGSTLLAVFETESTGLFSIASITSTDDGKSWSGRKTIYTPPSPYASAGAPQIINVGGTLVVSFQTNEDEALDRPAGNYLDGSVAKLVTSEDGGGAWGDKIAVGGVVSVWPGLVVLDSGSLLVLFDEGGAKGQVVGLS